MCLLLYRISPLIPKPALEFKPPALSGSHLLPTETRGHGIWRLCVRLLQSHKQHPYLGFWTLWSFCLRSILLHHLPYTSKFQTKPFSPSKCFINTTLRAVPLTTSTKTNQNDSELKNVEFGESIAMFTVTSSKCSAPSHREDQLCFLGHSKATKL